MSGEVEDRSCHQFRIVEHRDETMVRGGEHEAVREYRLRFQAVIAPELIRRVEDVMEREIVSYHSQILFDPDRLVEIFVLAPDAGLAEAP